MCCSSNTVWRALRHLVVFYLPRRYPSLHSRLHNVAACGVVSFPSLCFKILLHCVVVLGNEADGGLQIVPGSVFGQRLTPRDGIPRVSPSRCVKHETAASPGLIVGPFLVTYITPLELGSPWRCTQEICILVKFKCSPKHRLCCLYHRTKRDQDRTK